MQGERTFLHSLMEMPLDELKQQPSVIQAEIDKAGRQLAELAFTESNTFLSTHETLQETRKELKFLIDLFDRNISKEHSSLSEAFKVFDASSGKSSALLLDKNYESLQLLLQIPEVMLNLINSGHFDEALDLREHLSHLGIRFSHVSLVKEKICSWTEKYSKLIFDKCLANLESDISVNDTIKTMGVLRRMRLFDEYQLRFIFLRSKVAFFDQANRQLLSDSTRKLNVLKNVKNHLDMCRIEIREIVSQYYALFSDVDLANSHFDSVAMLSSALKSILVDLVDVFCVKMPEIDDISQISALVVQLMSIGLALSRKGFDFRFMIADKVRSAYFQIIENSICAAFTRFTTGNQKDFPFLLNAVLDIYNHARNFPILSMKFSVEKCIHAQVDALKQEVPFTADQIQSMISPFSWNVE